MRLLIVITLLLGAAALARPGLAQVEVDGYEQDVRTYQDLDEQQSREFDQQMREYDQRVAEAKQWEAKQQWKLWFPLGVFVSVLLIYLTYNRIATRRKYDAIMQQSQKNVDASLKQNQEMIDLLKSIDDRLGQDT